MAKERWRCLCEEIIAETDTQKLLSLVSQLEQELDCADPRPQSSSAFCNRQPLLNKT
jgi:hypothetical protein